MAFGQRTMGSSFFLLFVFFSFFGGGAPDDLASDWTALLAFRAAVDGVARRWNASNSSPCSWSGVTCATGRVTTLQLPGSCLVGQIPPGTLGNLTALRTLSLRYNLLSGTIPQDFAALTSLRRLHLQHNGLSGDIPTVVFALRHLVRLNLGHNSFSGAIPPAFNILTSLSTLLLEGNRLSGALPDLHLPGLRHFNVSFNQLNGSIPAGLRSLPASSFIGNTLCGGPLGTCPGEFPPAPSPLSPRGAGGRSKKLSAGAIAGIAIGSAAGLLVLLLLLVLCCRKKERGEAEPKAARKMEPESEMALRSNRELADDASGPRPTRPPPLPAAAMAGTSSGSGRKLVFIGKVQRIYDLEDLLRASAEVLGKGTTGTTYKAILEMGMVVVVKRLRAVNLSEKEFRERLEAIGATDHPNLVVLQAYYYSKDEKLLVYEFVPNGSLSSVLHGNTLLDWETRLEIALGAAQGIEYIHLKGAGVSHGNIKSSNVILSRSNKACVTDYGISSLVSIPMPNQRAAGYRAPEVTDARKVSQKADVYSFGVLLMELLTGRSPARMLNDEDGIDLPRWVQSVVREAWNSEVFDLKLSRHQNVEEEMAQLLQLAIDCAVQYPENRPSMSRVVARIEEIRSSFSMRHHV